MADSPFVKALVIAIFVMILVSLGAAARSLFRGRGSDDTATVRALTIRVALSVGLIALIGVLYALGIIHPNT